MGHYPWPVNITNLLALVTDRSLVWLSNLTRSDYEIVPSSKIQMGYISQRYIVSIEIEMFAA